MHNWVLDEVLVGGEVRRCTRCDETTIKVTNPELVGRTDIAEAMSGMTIRFSVDGPPQWAGSGTHPYAIGLSCGCVFPLELDFDPVLGVELPCPQHGDEPFEVLVVERLDLPY